MASTATATGGTAHSAATGNVEENNDNYAPIGTSGRVVFIECPNYYRRIVVPNVEASRVLCVDLGSYRQIRRENGAREVNLEDNENENDHNQDKQDEEEEEEMEDDDSKDDEKEDVEANIDVDEDAKHDSNGGTATAANCSSSGEGTTGKTEQTDDEEEQAEIRCTDRFIVEEVMHNDTPCAAFRTCGSSDRYLTCVLYGNQHRQDMAMALASSVLPRYVPVELIPTILDFVIPPHEKSFEGEGFNYFPITSEVAGNDGGEHKSDSRPNAFQLFRLRCQTDRHDNPIPIWKLGIETLVGKTYLRCQWWENKVSQSSHCRGDEQWMLHPHVDDERSDFNETGEEEEFDWDDERSPASDEDDDEESR